MELPLIKIRNDFNNCYLNSLLQSLFSLKDLNKKIIESDNEELINKKYYKIIKFLSKIEDDSIIFASAFISLFIKPEMQIGQQQDSDEIFTNFLDLHSEIEKEFLCQIKKIIYCESCFNQIEIIENINKIYIEPKETFKESIEKLGKSELLIDYKCDKCNCIGTSKLYTIIMSISNILCFVMKNYKMKFNQQITKKIKLQNNIYKLKSIIIHEGSLNSGHYYNISYRKNKWLMFNDDSNIYEIEDLNQCRGLYMLFYTISDT